MIVEKNVKMIVEKNVKMIVIRLIFTLYNLIANF